MPRLRNVLARFVLLLVPFGIAQPALHGQQRFAMISREALPLVPGLQIVTLRDTASQNACYTLFLVEAPAAASQAPPQTVESATAARDQRLQALAADFERAQFAPIPGVPSLNALQVELEAQRAQSDFNRAVLDYHFARLEESLAQLAKGSRLAVTGPASCPAQSGQK